MFWRRQTDQARAQAVCKRLGHWWKEWPHEFEVEDFDGRYVIAHRQFVRDCRRCKIQDTLEISSRVIGID